MSERLPYEDAFKKGMNDLPLPDSEQSWQKMEMLLDEDERKRRLLPPIFLNCAGWGALLLVVIIAGWFLLQPGDWFGKKEDNAQTKETVQKNEQENKKANRQTDISKNGIVLSKKDSSIKKIPLIISKTKDQKISNKIATALSSSINNERTVAAAHLKPGNKPKNKTAKGYQNDVAKTKENAFSKTGNKNKSQDLITNGEKTTVRKNDLTESSKDTSVQNVSIALKKDSLQIVDSSIKRNDSTSNNITNKKSGKHYYITVGLGEQQSINTDGQATVPYNYYGRTSSLSDYIPSIYVRLHRDEKWFLQGEFRYGAPQSVKEFAFSRMTKYDTSNATLNTTTTRIKKTYYHQIPFSFNYNVLPHLSIGVGGMYSLFYGAITEQETDVKNIQTGVETNTKQIVRVPNYTDSFLYKTQWRVLLQTNYQWKRFSIGVRYQKDLQPFIKYTAPNGNVHAEKNQSFDIFLRFQLWRSKKFKL